MRSDPKQFWRALKRGKRSTQGLPDISDTELFNHFASLNGTVPDMTSDFDTQIRATIQRDHGDGDVILDSVITMDVSTAITHMKSGKAAGVDRLIPELFIHGKDILLPYLTALFNVVFDSGKYPTAWAEGILHLIYKKGDVNDPANYGDITLLSCLGKLFERVLYNRIKQWEINNSVLNEEQAGFRSGYSTEDNLFVLQTLICKTLYSKERLYCGFIDLKKAYNSVYRQGLWYKVIYIYNMVYMVNY